MYTINNLIFKDCSLLMSVNSKNYKNDLNELSVKLLHASSQERNAYSISNSGYGIHWPLIDEDISVHAIVNSQI